MASANVTTSASIIVPARFGRLGVTIQNISDTDVYIGKAGVTAAAGGTAGLLLPAGASIDFTRLFVGDIHQEADIYAIHAASGNKEVRFLEF